MRSLFHSSSRRFSQLHLNTETLSPGRPTQLQTPSVLCRCISGGMMITGWRTELAPFESHYWHPHKIIRPLRRPSSHTQHSMPPIHPPFICITELSSSPDSSLLPDWPHLIRSPALYNTVHLALDLRAQVSHKCNTHVSTTTTTTSTALPLPLYLIRWWWMGLYSGVE